MTDEFEGYEILSASDMEDAEPDTERKLGAFVDPDLRDCPVVPLGFSAGHVWFAMPEGEIRHEPAAKIAGMLRADLFACAAGAAFLVNWRDPDDKFQRELAAIWFVRRCRAAGIWDDRRVVRSLGVWPGDLGAVVLHKGDEVWTFGADRTLTRRTIAQTLQERKGPLYRLRPPAPEPASPCDVSTGLWIQQTLEYWRFEAIGHDGLTGIDEVLGWLGAALLGAVAPFRGHVLLHAAAGSGKTTLAFFVQAVLSALAGDVIDSFTDAGLRNDLAGMARPPIIDEAEASSGINGPGLIERALELLRRMATGAGSTRKQGDIGGGTVTQTAVGAAWLSGVTPPRLGPADATRFVEVRLLPFKAPAPPGSGAVAPAVATDAVLTAAIERARELAPAILGRALVNAGRYREDFSTMKAAIARTGESPRTADLIAMLAAGRRLLLFDEPLSDAAADEEVGFWRPLLMQREQASMQSNTGADALAHLMAADSGLFSHDRRLTLAECIGELGRGIDNDGLPLGVDRRRKMTALLAAHGVKVTMLDKVPWLLVANAHPALERIYRTTAWRDWRRSLTELDGLGEDFATHPSPNSERFGDGVKQRALCIPLTPWLDERLTAAGTASEAYRSGRVPGEEHDF